MIQQASSTVCVSKIQLCVHTNEDAHNNIARSSTKSVSTRVDKQIHISKECYTALNMNKLQLNLKTQLTLWRKECCCQEGTYGCLSWMLATQNCIYCMYIHTHTHTHTHTHILLLSKVYSQQKNVLMKNQYPTGASSRQ